MLTSMEFSLYQPKPPFLVTPEILPSKIIGARYIKEIWTKFCQKQKNTEKEMKVIGKKYGARKQLEAYIFQLKHTAQDCRDKL